MTLIDPDITAPSPAVSLEQAKKALGDALEGAWSALLTYESTVPTSLPGLRKALNAAADARIRLDLADLYTEGWPLEDENAPAIETTGGVQ
jgi:hypothetical protein